MARIAMHERFDRHDEVQSASNRAFGAVFTFAFAAIALYVAWRGSPLWLYCAGVAALFGAVTLLIPVLLAPLNRLWMKVGILLSKAVTPVVMAILFYGTAMPTGWLMRVLGKDPLRLKWQRDAKSYWIPWSPPGPDRIASLRKQF